MIEAARSHGLVNGWTYATGPANSRSLGSMTRSQPFTAAQRTAICVLIDAIHADTEDFDAFPPDVQERLRHLI